MAEDASRIREAPAVAAPPASPAQVPAIAVESVTHSFETEAGTVPVLRDVSAEFRTGEVCALVGPSGSGKSTFLTIMGLLQRPLHGDVLIHGASTAGLGQRERTLLRSSAIGFVFQAFHLIEHKTVRENVLLPSVYSSGANDDRRRLMTAADEILARVGIDHRSDAYPRTLSGGEKQRCAIARALATDARIMLCDEPTGNLDAANTRSILELLQTLAHTQNRAVVIITHDHQVAAAADWTVTLTDGCLT